MSANTSKSLFAGAPRVLNIGLEGFATELAARGVAVSQLDWRPPAGGNPELADLLARLARHEKRIAKANAEGLRRMLAAEPVLLDVVPAGKAMPGLKDRVLLHSGPPIACQRADGG
jgi:hypothetical protein